LADRWLPELMGSPHYATGELSADTLKAFATFQPGQAPVFPPSFTPEVRRISGDENTSIADYVWLPIRFDGEMAYLDWHDEWRIEDFS
jgi:hypothetical protein